MNEKLGPPPDSKQMDVLFWVVAGLAISAVGLVIVVDIVRGNWLAAISTMAPLIVMLWLVVQRKRLVGVAVAEGRRAAITAALEALCRGLSLEEWVVAEMERDLVNIRKEFKL